MKCIYNFNEGSKDMKTLLGGKGANLAEMTKLKLPVPPGFTLTTKACNLYYEKDNQLWDELQAEIKTNFLELEKASGKKFGNRENPLLVSVRSGAVISMPGMMDTILNLGLNDDTVEGIADKTKNPRFAYDSYRRFIQMFSDVVMGIPKYKFERAMDKVKEKNNYTTDLDLTTENLIEIVAIFKGIYKKEMTHEFPTEPFEQLILAIEAVFKSWNNSRAKIYRKINGIKDNLGTAVNVQSMVFGNMGKTSGTGVAFTRNPSTGENRFFGEFLINAQGEDVVAGIRTPQTIVSLKNIMPKVYDHLIQVTTALENHYKDMQDIEFTIENETLYLLQTRTGKRTAQAAIHIAVDMVNDGIITKEEAILRMEANQLDQMLHPNFEINALNEAKLIVKGLPASPGAASGRAFFSADAVVEAHGNGVKSILVRSETSPEDIEGMAYAEGILTSRGGMTSHAAVVARGMGKCCIAGCSEIFVEEELKYFKIGNRKINEGEDISIDGSTGKVYLGDIPRVEPEISGKFETFMKWVDDVRRLRVRANADTAKDATTALKFGAEGIGLCRTEHMFFDDKRIHDVRKMILSKSFEERHIALGHLLPLQKDDFKKILAVMNGKNCTIRLLDPPLHEFLPKKDIDLKRLAFEMDLTYEEVINRVHELQEVNPMLGHRGCRLGITYPEIYEMQTEAIIEAGIDLKIEGYDVNIEIMVPLIGDKVELEKIKTLVEQVANKIMKERNINLPYLIGTMIEVPRAALLANEIAEIAEFFSFGTNDLTQMVYGFSRDDAGKFLQEYEKEQIIEKDPFRSLDYKGVGKLMKMAVKLGKETNQSLKLGICGEHGGDPKSIDFCHRIGLDYVSCSPYRVPIARLAASQAMIRENTNV